MDESIIIFTVAGIILFTLILLVLTSRTRIVRIYDKYLQVPNKANITGEQFALAARKVLGYNDIQLSLIKGKLTDCYSGGKHKYLFVSEEVAHSNSIAALAIVAHEYGHAIQDHTDSTLYKSTRILNKITRITSKLVIPAILVGLGFVLFDYYITVGYGLIITASALVILNFLFKVLTIPMERDASMRALRLLKEYELLAPNELGKARKLLDVASQTYMVALLDDLIIVKLIRRYRITHGKYSRG